VKSKEQLHREELAKIDPESAEDQYAMGIFCEQILDFARALEHYQTASALDASFKPQELETILARVGIKVQNQEQVDFLANVDLLKRRDRFDDALSELLLFDALFQDSPLQRDRQKMEQRVLKARANFMHEEVQGLWFSWMGRLSAKASREKTFDESLAYLEEEFSSEIVSNVTRILKKNWAELEEEQVRQFFAERKPGRWKPASYGLGTWLLGEEDALKGAGPEKEKAKSLSSRDKERREQSDKIQRFLRNQQMAKRSRRSDDDEQEVERAWTILQSSARRNWLVAYYAENGGDLHVRPKPELRDCSECGGTGVRDIVYTGNAKSDVTAGRAQVPCSTCHSVGKTRRIRYR
jgi:hypothetical protein